MHTYHNSPIRVYKNPYVNDNSSIMDACPIPSGFYIKVGRSNQYVPTDFSVYQKRDRDLYVKTTDGQYVQFPFKLPRTIRCIHSNELVS